MKDYLLSRYMERDGCWIWTAAKNSRGYGHFTYARRTYYAHRVSYEVFKGAIPEGMFACHTCDTVDCINPDHLWVGTHAENMADMRRKGRSLAGDRSWSKRNRHRLSRGETHYAARLSDADVDRIRELRANGASRQEVAEMYGLHPVYVSKLTNGRARQRVAA